MKKYEREIAELLEKMDDFIPNEEPRRRPKRSLSERIRRIIQAIPTYNWSPRSLIVASIILAFLAFLLRDIFRPAAPLASIASVALLLGALVTHVVQRRRRPEQRWRGRVIEIESYRPHSFSSLGYRWRRIWRSLWQRHKKKH